MLALAQMPAAAPAAYVAVPAGEPSKDAHFWEAAATYHALCVVRSLGHRFIPGLVELPGLSIAKVIASQIPLAEQQIERELALLQECGAVAVDAAAGIVYLPALVSRNVPASLHTVAAIARQWVRVKHSPVAQRAARDLLLAAAAIEPERERRRRYGKAPDVPILERLQRVFGLAVVAGVPPEDQQSLRLQEPGAAPVLRVVEVEVSNQIPLPLGATGGTNGTATTPAGGRVAAEGGHAGKSARPITPRPLNARGGTGVRAAGGCGDKEPVAAMGPLLAQPGGRSAGDEDGQAGSVPVGLPVSGPQGYAAAWVAAAKRCPLLDGGFAITPTSLTYAQQSALVFAWTHYGLTETDLLTLADYCNAGGFRKLSNVMRDLGAAVSDAKRWRAQGGKALFSKQVDQPAFLSRPVTEPQPAEKSGVRMSVIRGGKAVRCD